MNRQTGTRRFWNLPCSLLDLIVVLLGTRIVLHEPLACRVCGRILMLNNGLGVP